jgi:ABC-type transporter Mla subunit MlaD
MAATLIQLDPRQKTRLKRRAKLNGRSVSEEVQHAIDLYLVLSPDIDKELAALARSANEAAKHSVRRLDETIAFVGRILKKMNARRVRSQQSES